MYISKVALRNYKSIYGTSELIFRPGFNFITGQNNSGKTALLEMLSLRFDYKPHRSLVTLPNEGMDPTAPSEIDLDFVLAGDEVKTLLLLQGANTNVFLPVPDQGDPFVRANGLNDPTRLVNWFLSLPELTFCVRLTRLTNTASWAARARPSFGLYLSPVPAQTTPTFVMFRVRLDLSTEGLGIISGDQNLEIGCQLVGLFQRSVYMFEAERFKIGRCNFGASNALAPNASNLPEVLTTLQGNPDKFEFYSKLVRSVLPQVKEVSVVPNGGQVEIRIWTIDPATRRVDLSRSLGECGTGVGQVLAILYAAVNSLRRGVLLIDEPQSFLHPGAARKLMQILHDYPQHQYICSTHSASIMSSVDPETITVTRLIDEKSEVVQVDPVEPRTLQMCLAEVGARLSDVFGADQILWVEGRTEEHCFPLIVQSLLGKRLMGTVIIGLRSTGELEGSDAERVMDIYSRLSTAKSLMPPAVGFIFDQEGRTPAERDDIARRTGPPVRFLPRRMYENYMLNPAAIALVLTELDSSSGRTYSPAEIDSLMEAEQLKAENFRPLGLPQQGEDWRATIHGAKLLKKIFGTLSEQRARYGKVRDGEALTREIIKAAPSDLAELTDLLREFVA